MTRIDGAKGSASGHKSVLHKTLGAVGKNNAPCRMSAPLSVMTLDDATFVYSEILAVIRDFQDVQRDLLQGGLTSKKLKALKKRLEQAKTNQPTLQMCLDLLAIRLYLLEVACVANPL